jgi:D-alanyl-D-alanine carboxypeptidase
MVDRHGVDPETATIARGLYPSPVPSPRRIPLARIRLARVRGLAVGLLVAASAAAALLGASLATPVAVAGMGPLPDCRYDDILTSPRGYGDWSTTLVDTILEVTVDYVPPDLVAVSEAGIGGSGKIRAVTLVDLEAMTVAAKAAGNPIGVQSAYRSYTTQVSVFNAYVRAYGETHARLISARPGHSEHQLGLAIDFKTAGGGSPFNGDWGTTPAGIWMRKHAWQYGWVQSYPKGQQARTCYEYESWHFRYVGRALAAKIHASGLTPRQYLWAHFTTATVPAPSTSPWPIDSPAASSPATLQPSPSAHPSASPDPSPSAGQSGLPGSSPSASPDASPVESPGATPSAPPTDGPSPSASPAGGGPSPVGATVDPATAAAAIGLLIGVGAIGSAMALVRRRRWPSERGP